jgi:uncharacterized protein
VVERILAACGRTIDQVLGDSAFLRDLRPEDYTDDRFGVPTVTDILAELEKPGRDPRPEFETASFREGVEDLADLEPGMVLEGVVTNVTNFGAFVDVGVHQDGLVHISQLADRFVSDPREEVKPGDVVKVRVLEVDTERRRIGLSMKMQSEAGEGRTENPSKGKAKGGGNQPGKGTAPRGNQGGKGKGGKAGKGRAQEKPAPQGALAEAFRRAQADQEPDDQGSGR